MDTKSQAAWIAPTRTDTMLNGMLLGTALIVVMYAAVSGTFGDGAPQSQVASAAVVQPAA